MKVQDRLNKYSSVFDYELPVKLPVITIISGRNFGRLTGLINKPFSEELSQCLSSALLKVMQEVDGAVFGYSFSDEIVVISRNDNTHETLPWLNNKIQKLASITASIATASFNIHAAALDLTLLGEASFSTQVFTVPNITEAINVLVSKQQQGFKEAAKNACLYELLKKSYDKEDIESMLANTSTADKIDLLEQSGIIFDEYPMAFRRGVACFRAPHIVMFENREVVKNSYCIKNDLPIFTQDHAFLQGIFKTGSDILRKE